MIDDRTLLNLVAWWGQIGLVVGAAAALPRLLKVIDPDVRHLYWRVLLILCLALPIVQPWRAPAPLRAVGATAGASKTLAGDTASQAGAEVPSPATAAVSRSYAWLTPLMLFLATVAVGRAAWLIAGILRLNRLRRDGSAVGAGDVTAAADALPTAAAEIRYVPRISQPITFGLRRPVICLPLSLRTMPPDLRHVVLAHELWHVRRRDWIWLVTEEAVRSLLWFHPAIHWVISRVQRSREEVVDELTVLETNARRTYLEALLAFADGPVPFPVAPFARRRHLFQRIQLISREAVMSSKRVVVSSVVMIAVVAAASLYGASQFPLTAQPAATVFTPQKPPPPPPPPRDPRPGAPRPATAKEGELKKSIAADPGKPAPYLELAKLQEDRNAIDEAESTLSAARSAVPNNTAILTAVAQFHNRRGEFQKTIQALEDIAALDPSDPSRHQTIATFYWDKASKDKALSPGDKLAYLQSGIAATDRAIALNGDYVDALVYKSLFLRIQAQMETDATRQQQLTAEADQLRDRAMRLQASSRNMPPPPPPPPPPGGGSDTRTLMTPDGQTAVRVGGNIKVPTKTKDVHPIYPEEAMAAKVAGVVIIEAVIDTSGHVSNTRVLRSIPLLDQAALDAVKQWEFTVTNVNDVPVPVVMTVTVNFTLQ